MQQQGKDNFFADIQFLNFLNLSQLWQFHHLHTYTALALLSFNILKNVNKNKTLY